MLNQLPVAPSDNDKNATQKVRSNIRKLYGLIIAQDALTIMPVFVPFMQLHGLTLQQIFMLQGIYTFTWVIADVPTGYFADVWSRRQSLIVGSFFLCLSGIGFALGGEFWHFCIAEVLFGVGRAFNCGTIQAMTYDTLTDLNDTGSYRKISSSQSITSYLSTALAGIAGGLAAQTNMQYAGAMMLPFFVMALLISLSIHEPKRHSLKQSGHIRGAAQIFYQTLFVSRPLSIIILAYGLLASMTFSLVWFTQPYQSQLNMPVSYFGISTAIFMCGMMAASRWAYVLEKRMDDRVLLIMTLATTLLCFLLLGLNVSEAGLLFLFIGRASYGMMDTLTSDMINRLTTSDRRATVLSMRSFVYNLIFTVFSPLIGYSAKVFTLNQAIFMVGIGSAILMIPLAIMLKKSWVELPA